MKFLKDILTDEFGQDYDTVSVLSVLMVVVGIVLKVISFFKPQFQFDMISYSAGCSSLLAVITGAMRFKPAGIPPK